MTKANEVRPGALPGLQPTVQEKEAEKVKTQAQQKVTSQDAARIAQQAGFQRLKQAKKGLDIGDSSRAPIPLPDDDTQDETWSQERLEKAQQNLGLATTQFDDVEKAAAGDSSIGQAVVGGSFLPTEKGLADLEDLAKRPAPTALPLEEVTTNVERLFKIKLEDSVPVGHKVLATGLVVAGEVGSVSVDKGTLNEKKLAGGLKKVTERGNQAVGEAQKMSKGINRELNVQRTFLHKR
ncbi:MAG: hypothetical protein HY903_16510 [Deltaproteobacteria bacterium]|nr:hypothetical protein [Deltaproteobacteria bacterium]